MTSPVVPFIGYRSWEHDPVRGEARVLSVCDMDFSGTKIYKFNRLGFRGEEFDPDAAKRIFFCGCSYTFGTGLNIEETASHKFKLRYCDSLGLAYQAVNALNFAMPGASNDYIVRTLLAQCRLTRPDVVVAIFSHVNRAEHIDEQALGERVWTAAPWWVREVTSELRAPNAAAEQRTELMREASLGYIQYTTPANAASNFLRNALLLQFYCETNSIPYVFHWVEFDNFSYLENHFALGDTVQLLNRSHFADYANSKGYWCDRAADGAHPGPESNSNIANALFDVYRRLYQRQA